MIRLLTALTLCTALVASCDEAGDVSDPIIGPRTKDADAFAIDYLDKMQARSFAREVEFCGYFGRDAEGYIIATAPIVGHLDSCRPPDTASNFNAFASYHSHSAYDEDADSEVPSTNDVLADLHEDVIGYISTPGGRVWRSEDGVATVLCGPSCIAVDPDFVPEVFGPVQRRYTLDDLRKRESY